MKYHVSRLKIFDSESMSESTPQVTGIRATERMTEDSTRLLQNDSSVQLKASVKDLVSGYSQRNFWKGIEERSPEPDELVNARLRARTSKKHLHLEHHRLA